MARKIPLAETAEDRISFSLVNKDAIDRLVKDGQIKLPKKKVNIPKDKQWNEKQMASKMLRGIQNGDSIDQIAQNLLKVVDNNEASAIRNARTMFTSAENHGRLDSYKNLSDQGVVMKKEWEATPDDRTRPSHVDIDGEEKDINEPFSNGCMFPGDGNGPAEEVWCCRCAMGSHIIGFRRKDGSISEVGYARDATMHDWQMEAEKEKRGAVKPSYVIVNGTDISETWQRRPDQFDFEIEDVINAQGFDGLPRVVSPEEFEKYVQDSNMIMQRGYTAPDQETLIAYQNELYKGKWYVDCSSGGHMYGRGMYADGTFGTKVNETMEATMQGYGAGPNGRVETFTLTSDAKILDYKDIDRLRQEYGRDIISKMVGLEKASEEERVFAYSQMGMTNTEETIKSMNWVSENSSKVQDVYTKYIAPYGREIGEIRNAVFSMDEGVLATLKGYDAINCENIVQGDTDGYFVILNRTKCIFKGE